MPTSHPRHDGLTRECRRTVKIFKLTTPRRASSAPEGLLCAARRNQAGILESPRGFKTPRQSGKLTLAGGPQRLMLCLKSDGRQNKATLQHDAHSLDLHEPNGRKAEIASFEKTEETYLRADVQWPSAMLRWEGEFLIAGVALEKAHL